MDVALIQWPSEEALRRRLAGDRRPRLLLVDAGAEPPECVDPLEDWVRLPVSRPDRNARIRALESRAGISRPVPPTLNGAGTLEYQGERTQLSEVQSRLIAPMIDAFGVVVPRDRLVEATWGDGDPSSNNLDVSVARLRKALAPVPLEIATVRSRGYILRPAHPLR